MAIDLTRPGLFRSVFYFLVLYALFRVRAYVGVEPAVGQGDMMPLQAWIAGFFEGHVVWKEIALFGLSLLNAFYITRILSQNLIYPERTYVPALIYGMAAMGYAVSGLTVIMLAVAFLLIFAVDNLIRSYKREGYPGYFLNASVVLGTAPLLYAPSAGLLLLLPVGLVLFKQGWRSVVTAILGVLLPVFFYSYILWGIGGDFDQAARQIVARAVMHGSGEWFGYRIQLWEKVLAGIYGFLTLAALIRFGRQRTATRRRSLRGYTLFVWLLIFCISLAVLPGQGPEWLPLAAVPLAAIIPACFNRRSGWWPNLLYTLMTGSVIIYNLCLVL